MYFEMWELFCWLRTRGATEVCCVGGPKYAGHCAGKGGGRSNRREGSGTFAKCHRLRYSGMSEIHAKPITFINICTSKARGQSTPTFHRATMRVA